MIIEKPYEINDVVSVKLSSGEEIVGKLVGESPEVVTIAKPLMLAHTPQGMGLAPYMMTVDPEKAQLKFNERNIITITKTMDTMSKQYIQSTTGLVT